MGILVLKRDTSGGTKYLDNLFKYVKYDRQTGKIRNDFVAALGYGVDYSDMDQAYHQMLQVRRYYGKESGNPLVHYIFAFDSKVKNEEDAVRLSAKIAHYFQSRYQLLAAIHRKKSPETNRTLYHMHLVINSVSYVDGKMISTWKSEIEAFRLYTQNVTGSLVNFYFAGEKDDI